MIQFGYSLCSCNVRDLLVTLRPVTVLSIAISVSVCLRLSVRSRVPKTVYVQISQNFLYTSHGAVAQFCSDALTVTQ